MAFLPFDEHGNALLSAARRVADDVPPAPPASPAPATAAPAAPETAASAAPAAPAALSPLEWTVVQVARGDRLGSLARPGRLSAWVRAALRLPNPRLADARLEALRRMAVLTWHHGFAVPGRDIAAFLAAGFTPDQYEALAAAVGAAHLARRR